MKTKTLQDQFAIDSFVDSDLEAYPRYTLQDKYQGYVYLLLAKNGLVKIGQTMNLPSRIKRHRRKLKGEFEFRIIAIVSANHCRDLEGFIHREFKNKRETKITGWRGDWFRLTNSDVAYIKSLDGEI